VLVGLIIAKLSVGSLAGIPQLGPPKGPLVQEDRWPRHEARHEVRVGHIGDSGEITGDTVSDLGHSIFQTRLVRSGITGHSVFMYSTNGNVTQTTPRQI
jgi:hypothetical protein